jgi:hypothetical protein
VHPAPCRANGIKGEPVSDLWRAVKDTDESVRLLAQGLNILTDQQNIQVEFLRKIFDLVRAMQPVLNETHEAVTAPAPPSPVADALARLAQAVEANTVALARLEQMLARQ